MECLTGGPTFDRVGDLSGVASGCAFEVFCLNLGGMTVVELEY